MLFESPGATKAETDGKVHAVFFERNVQVFGQAYAVEPSVNLVGHIAIQKALAPGSESSSEGRNNATEPDTWAILLTHKASEGN